MLALSSITVSTMFPVSDQGRSDGTGEGTGGLIGLFVEEPTLDQDQGCRSAAI